MPEEERIPISEFDEAPQLDNNDVIPVLHPINNVLTTVKTKLTALGTHLLKVMQFASDLNTNNKTIIGAINELEAGGGGGGSSTLAGLTDTNIVTPQNKQGLVYNSTNSKWENQDIASDFDITKTFSATPIATLTDGAENIPMKSLVVDIVPKQASGTPTPDNPLPISGTDEFVVVQANQNFWDEAWEQTSAQQISSTNYCQIKGGLTYGYTKPNDLWLGVYWYDKNKTYLSVTSKLSGSTGTITAPDDAFYFQIKLGGSGTTQSGYANNLSINYPSTDTTYHASTGQATTITKELPRIIYGGEVDVVSGQGTVKRWYKKVKWSEGTNVVSLGDYTRKIFNFETTGYNVYPQTVAYPQLCNVATYLANFNTDSLHFYANANSIIVFLPNDTDGDTEIEVTGELTTPTPFTTTPTTIKTRGGTESIFADCGDVSGEYYTEQADDIVDLHNAIDAEKETVLAGTLEAGETEITFTSDKITTDSMIEIWTSPVGVNYSAIAVSTGEVVITFEEQASDIGVKVVIK